ncbi:MAG TPA: hypothetical protein VNO30_18270 [Kofleriaceae bacterium]|nr:hypothetical protein [Kofleriaceae bacterium]
MTADVELHRGARVRVSLLVHSDRVPVEFERELAEFECAAIVRGAPVELLDEIALLELGLRKERGRSRL